MTLRAFRRKLWNLGPIRSAWLRVWSHRLEPGEKVALVTGWRSALIDRLGSRRHVTFENRFLK